MGGMRMASFGSGRDEVGMLRWRRYQANPVYEGWVWAPQVLSAVMCSHWESSYAGAAQWGSSPRWNCHSSLMGTVPWPMLPAERTGTGWESAAGWRAWTSTAALHNDSTRRAAALRMGEV